MLLILVHSGKGKNGSQSMWSQTVITGQLPMLESFRRAKCQPLAFHSSAAIITVTCSVMLGGTRKTGPPPLISKR